MRELGVLIHGSPILYRFITHIDSSITVSLQMVEFQFYFYLILSAVHGGMF